MEEQTQETLESNDVELESFDDDNSGEIDTFEDPALSQTEIIGETDGDDEDSEADESEDDSEEKEEDDSESEDDEPENEVEDDSEDKESVDDDSVFKVKVDGEEQEVTLKDLKNSWSGHKAVEKRFTELNREKRKMTREISQKEEELQRVTADLTKHLDTIDGMLNDPRLNPLEALYYLVDLKGGNTVEYEKKMMDSLFPMFEQYMEMDEVEKELFWTRKEKDFLTRRRESNFSKAEQEQASRTSQAELEKLWETHQVSEDDYYDGFDELKEMGYDEIEPEQVVNYLALKPVYEKADSISSEFKSDLGEGYEEFVDGIAKAIQNFPNASDEDLIRLVAKNMGIEVEDDDSEVEELKRKIPRKGLTKPSKKRVTEIDIDTW